MTTAKPEISDETSSSDLNNLKQLLFANEQEAIDLLSEQIAQHEERIGSQARMQASVADILDGALRDAGMEKPRELSSALAPLIVNGIRREIQNSRDQMVQALYPIVGRLVSSYVANAFRELLEETNKKIEQGLSARLWWLRMRSLVSRHSYQELVLAEAGRAELQELLLIRRGSGLLLDHWFADETRKESEDVKGREQMVSGMISAITDFSEEAFAGNHQSLRAMDIGGRRVYLRAAPAYLVVAIFSGSMAKKTERALDQEFFALMERHSEALAKSDDLGGDDEAQQAIKAILPDFSTHIQALLSRRKKPVAAIIVLLGVLLLAVGLGGWSFWLSQKRADLRQTITDYWHQDKRLAGYPLQLDIAFTADHVSVQGLVPDMITSETVRKDLKAAIAPVPLTAHLSELATVRGLDDRSRKAAAATLAEFAALKEQLVAAQTRIDGDLARRQGEALKQHNSINKAISTLQKDVQGVRNQQAAGRRQDSQEQALLRDGLKVSSLEIARINKALQERAGKGTVKDMAGQLARLSVSIQQLSHLAEGMTNKADKAELQSIMRQVEALTNLSDRLERQNMVRLLTETAIFFTEKLDLKDPEGTGKILDSLALQIKRTGIALRVVGFTDDRGRASLNRQLSVGRANYIREQLVARGVPAGQLIAIGTPGGPYLRNDPSLIENRRVHFEMMLPGERSVGQEE